MQPSDVTIEILKGIRDEARATNARLDTTNARLDETNARLTAMREELSRRIVESEVRPSAAIAELAGTVREMTGVLRAAHDLRPRVERCERDIDDLKRRLSAG
jgi:uncharacterized protein Yka (UPF0111/DUF47 family)